MKSYLLNKWENKIEVYKTVYYPERGHVFTNNCTLFIYCGSLPIHYKGYNTNHAQVEICKAGNHSASNYYGNRTIGDKFQKLSRLEAISLLKNISK